MVQFLSINFFSWISSIFVGFIKSSHFFLCHPVEVIMDRHTCWYPTNKEYGLKIITSIDTQKWIVPVLIHCFFPEFSNEMNLAEISLLALDTGLCGSQSSTLSLQKIWKQALVVSGSRLCNVRKLTSLTVLVQCWILCVMFLFYIYCSVHRNILWNDQQMRQCAVSLFLWKSTLHVSGGTHAHHQEYRSNCIYSHWY